MMIKLVNFYHFRLRNMKSGPRPGKGQASRLKPISRPLFVYRGHGVGHDMKASCKTVSGTWHRPQHESQCSYSKLMRYESEYVALMCRQASVRDQGTSEALITLSPEALA
ncbi:Corticoliberin [Gossypium arboreum]|uniref:Corticoliberin n=1 Tax=Gossypium arboreum TaxID=29729 RepID=A0A0B0NAL1_GOSAR|nr:Corticoliberin [Gossypium arboreum]